MNNFSRIAQALSDKDANTRQQVQVELEKFFDTGKKEETNFTIKIDPDFKRTQPIIIRIWFDQNIDGKIYERLVTATVHPCFFQEFYIEYNLEKITLEKTNRKYNYLPSELIDLADFLKQSC